MTAVKVCGLTRDEDVRAAVAFGASACGFVLCESPRRVSAERACWLAGEADGVLTVGVVAAESPGEIAATIAFAGLHAVQLSAGGAGASVTAVRAATAGLDPRPLVIAAADAPDAAAADMTLLDARPRDRRGGTAEPIDWDRLAGSTNTPRTRLVLTGGLEAGTVGAAIRALRPLLVDVAGGVESALGVKDAALLRAFFTAVAAADKDGRPGVPVR